MNGSDVPVIRIEPSKGWVSLKLRIGAKQERYKTFRDTLVNACSAPFRKIKNPKFLAVKRRANFTGPKSKIK